MLSQMATKQYVWLLTLCVLLVVGNGYPRGPWSLLRSPYLHPDHPLAKKYFPPSQWFMKTSPGDEKRRRSASDMCKTLYDMVRLGKRATNLNPDDSCISNLMESYERLEELKDSCIQDPTFECLSEQETFAKSILETMNQCYTDPEATGQLDIDDEGDKSLMESPLVYRVI